MAWQQTPEQLADACGEDPSWVCRQVLEWTDSEGSARAADFATTPGRIVLIVVVAWLANRLVRRAIGRFTDRMTAANARERVQRWNRRAPETLQVRGPESLRSAARAKTLSQVLRSSSTVLIWVVAWAMILGELGINLGPLIAGAGIAGVAIGFGAQSLVKDFLSGMFMLIEDQYGVGDVVDAGEATGTVEAVSLRTTRLRDVNGTVWHIPNGNIVRVGNMSQQWARALLDVGVAYGTDIDKARTVIKRVADEMWGEPAWRGQFLEEPEVWGVEQLGVDAVAIRLVVKTLPGEQWGVMRELRRRLFDAFNAEGIEIPFPQRSVWIRREPGSSRDTEPSL